MTTPFDARTKDSLIGAVASMVGFVLCLWFMLPASADAEPQSVPRIVMLALGMSVALVLHLVFVGICARRLGRSVVGWVLLSLITFPIGSVVAGLLLLWFSEAPPDDRPAPLRQ
jgi:drug/metabolite transporter (DMT)-like permease